MLCNRHLRRCGMGLGLPWVAFSLPAWAGPGLVRTVRCATTDQSARVVIDVSRPLSYGVSLSDDSTTLVVDIPDAVSEASLGEVRVGACGVVSVVTRTIKSAHPSRGEVRLPLDAAVAWNHFSLPASKGKPARIVLDVAPAANVPTSVTAMADSETPAIADTETAAPLAAPSTRASPGRPFVVAIDAGHGGHDTRTVGPYGLTAKKLTPHLSPKVADDLKPPS